MERARRYGRELSLVYLDIDHFKAINDSHGHDAGDTVLQQLADKCRGRLQANDICARMGGEEFAILLPETGPRETGSIAESLRQIFADSRVYYNGTKIHFTCSFGVSALTADPEDTLEELLRRADRALYRAKESGRNRIVIG